MPMNRIQFQSGVSLPEFFERYGREEQCEAALMALRWPDGFRCPRCASAAHYVVTQGSRRLFQCRECRHQTSLTAGTLMDSTKLPLRTWFLAIYLVSQDKTGLASLALKRHLGTSYRTAWLIHQKLMAAMAQHDSEQPLEGSVQLDDAYLGGERPGKAGRGSPNKVPIVAAVQTNDLGHPMRVKVSPVAGFTHHAIARWARANLLPGCDVRSDGLACFAAVIDAGCAHSYIVVGNRKPRELPQFTWVNTILANLKTMIGGGHKAFKFRKYASQYLGAFAYRFNARFDLRQLLTDLLGHAATAIPTRERHIRGMAEVHD
ncbi:MAG TPA: IS1595 family transposase [Accumulibacter sp.]|nr:IS1595 family transposase [Accumulibacter sp.]